MRIQVQIENEINVIFSQKKQKIQTVIVEKVPIPSYGNVESISISQQVSMFELYWKWGVVSFEWIYCTKIIYLHYDATDSWPTERSSET